MGLQQDDLYTLWASSTLAPFTNDTLPLNGAQIEGEDPGGGGGGDGVRGGGGAGGSSGGVPIDFIINGIGITVVASLGIVGNLLSAIVLSRPQMKSSVTCLLLGLAFCDTLLISTSILIFGIPSIADFAGSLRLYRLVYYPLSVPYLFPVSITAQTGSVYLTLAVTIERYIAVCHPLKARSLCTWRRAVICVVTVMSMATLYNLPRWFEVCTEEVGPLEVDGVNVTVYGATMCPMRESTMYKLIYINWLYLIVMYLVPFSGLAVGNWAIYRQVRKANRERAVMSKLQKRELGLATMLLFVVGVFLLCNVLPLVNNILESFYDHAIDQLVQLSNFLVIFNSSVNFVIYCSCGERFRRLLLRMLSDCAVCPGKVRKKSLNRKSNFYRGRHGGGFEEVSLASVAATNYTCVTGATNLSGSKSGSGSGSLSTANGHARKCGAGNGHIATHAHAHPTNNGLNGLKSSLNLR